MILGLARFGQAYSQEFICISIAKNGLSKRFHDGMHCFRG